MNPVPPTVLLIESPSYTGTTWLGMLLGAHPRGVCLGAPDRVWAARHGDWSDTCRVHGPSCPAWAGFGDAYDAGENLYLQVCRHFDADFVVINNPTDEHAQAELEDPRLVVKRLRVVRDGRAIAWSFARHHDADYIDGVRFVEGMQRRMAFPPEDEAIHAIRYEDLLDDPEAGRAAIGAWAGIDYSEQSLRTWDHDLHVTSGNAGTIRLHQELAGIEFGTRKNPSRQAWYVSMAEHMRETGSPFRDDRWQEAVGPRERFVFDAICGPGNERWGYEPDRFSRAEREAYERDLGTARRGRGWLRDASAQAHGVARAAQHRLDGLSRQRTRLAALAGAVALAALVLVVVVAFVLGRVTAS